VITLQAITTDSSGDASPTVNIIVMSTHRLGTSNETSNLNFSAVAIEARSFIAPTAADDADDDTDAADDDDADGDGDDANALVSLPLPFPGLTGLSITDIS
jgi:hypothetical protein